MHVELLTTPPISGTVVERHFDVSARKNAWVRFEDDEGAVWVGVFGSSEPVPFCAVVPFADDGGRTMLIIAGGQGYVVNARSGSLIRRTPWDYAHAAATVPGRDFVLVADATMIWAADRAQDRAAWRLDRALYDYDETAPAHRLALDGIIFDRVTPNELTGKVWEMNGWYAFRLGLPGLEFVRGELLAADREVFWAVPPAG
ncbi:MAG: hypothetical protein U0164_20805 [Gemmatimonadaceae bacterium]